MKKQQGMTIRKRVGNQVSDKIPDIKYNDLYLLYVKDCRLRNISEITIAGYQNANKYFLDFAGHDILCSDVNQDLITDYMLFLRQRLKPTTVNSYVFKVSPVVLFGVRRGYIKQDIHFSHMVEQEHFKEIYSDEELALLLKKPVKNTFAEYRSWVIVNLLLATGIRSLELRELLIKDLDLNNCLLTLRHTKNKKARVLPLSNTLVTILTEYLNFRNATEDEPLFCNIYGEPLPRTTLQLSISKYNKQRGVSKTSLHLFRHTFITMSVRSGMSPLLLKRITGHKGLKELENYYNYNASDLVQVINNFNPLEKFEAKKQIVFDTGKKKAKYK